MAWNRAGIVWIVAASLLGGGCENKPEAAPTKSPSAGAPGGAPGVSPTGGSKAVTPAPVAGADASSAVIINAPVAAGRLSATVVADLTELRKKTDGARLVAAARFEPDGAQFPEGIEVSWPLSEAQPPGSQLWIVHLDEKAGRWLNTGQRSIVDASGRRATGKVFHFSTAGNAGDPPPTESDSATTGVFANLAKVMFGKDHAAKVTAENLKTVTEVYERTGGKTAPMTKARMQQIYQAGDFATVKTLIEREVIDPQHSLDMADLRILMTIETLEHIITKQKQGKWRIYRSDSGNQKAGMRSDIDQTLYVLEKQEDGSWKRLESGDRFLVDNFAEIFADLHKLAVKALDISTIAGCDKFPDWRTLDVRLEAEGKRPYERHADETMFRLRRTPGAYTYCGAVVQQMQLRVLDMVENYLAKGKGDGRPPEPRGVHADLLTHCPDFKLNNLVCMKIGPGDEPGDDTVRAREAFQEEAIGILFDGLRPKLIRGHAYDASVANYLEYMHHLGEKYPAVKYLLRALDDGPQAIERANKGYAKFEYGNVHSLHRYDHLARVLGQDLAVKQWDGHSFIDRWKVMFDVAATIREHHSKERLNDARYAEALEPLVKELKGPTGDIKNPEHLAAARAEFDIRCQEFMIHNMIAMGDQRIGEFLRPTGGDDALMADLFRKAVDEPNLRKALGLEGEKHQAEWIAHRERLIRKLVHEANNQLLYSFREMRHRPDVIKMILDRARKKYTPEEMARLEKVVADSKNLFFGVTDFFKFNDYYRGLAMAYSRKSIGDFFKSHWDGVRMELGFIETPDGPRPGKMLSAIGSERWKGHVDEFLKKNKMLAAADRRFGHAFMNIGSIAGVANVMKVYSETNGDPTEVAKSIARETLMLLFPELGLAYSSYETGLDAKQQILLFLVTISPTGQAIMVCYAVVEAGLAIHENQYVAPCRLQTADALYRGYIGPSQYDFSQEGRPTPLTDEEQRRLMELRNVIAAYSALMERGSDVKLDALTLAAAGRDARPLIVKEEEWKAFEAEEGRKDGPKEQRRLGLGELNDPAFQGKSLGAGGGILGGVQMIVYYSRNRDEGAVDLLAPALTPKEVARLEVLNRPVPNRTNVIDALDLEFEKADLDRKQQAHALAVRYLADAARNHELKLQIQRDSMFPSMIKDRESVARMFDAKHFVDTWILLRKDLLKDAIKAMGISEALEPWDQSVKEELTERLSDDLDRSRRLWYATEGLRKAKAAAYAAERDKVKGAILGEMLFDAIGTRPMDLDASIVTVLGQAGLDPREAASAAAMGRAIFQRNIPEARAPEVEVSVRALPPTNPKTKMTSDLHADVKVSADPTVYVPPYFSVPYILDPLDARKAVSEGSWMGLPLSAEMKAYLNRYIEETQSMIEKYDPKEDPFPPAMLVYVFCTDEKIPTRIVPETVEHLPRLVAYDIKPPEGTSLPKEFLRGYLFGGASGAPKPDVMPSGALSITGSHRWKLAIGESDTAIEVQSKAMAKLDPKDMENGLLFKIYWSFSPEGPFQESRWLPGDSVFGDTPIKEPSADGSEPFHPYRKSKDVFVLKIAHKQANELHGHRPMYFQVGQTAAKGKFKKTPVGQEERSNVLAPCAETRTSVILGGTIYESVSLTVKLGLECQDYFARVSHTVATVNGRTVHGWGTPMSSIHVPVPLGQDVSISLATDGDGMRGATTVPITATPAAKEQQRKRLADLDAEEARLNKDKPARIASLKKALDALPSVPARPPSTHTRNTDLELWARAAISRFKARYDYRYESEYVYPEDQANLKRRRAEALWNWKLALQCADDGLNRVDVFGAIQNELVTAVRDVLQAVETAPLAAGDTAASRKRVNDTLRTLEPLTSSLDDSRVRALEEVMTVALGAVNPARYESALAQLIQIRSKLTGPKRNCATVYARAADALAAMTGDVSRSVELYNKSVEEDVKERPQEAQAIRERGVKARPLWWPQGAK